MEMFDPSMRTFFGMPYNHAHVKRAEQYLISRGFCRVLWVPITERQRNNPYLLGQITSIHANDVIFVVKAEANEITRDAVVMYNLADQTGWKRV
jgi:hypothetical protein